MISFLRLFIFWDWISEIQFPFRSNNCSTSIFDFHRSCARCSYELCLSCCREIREGNLRDGSVMQFDNRGTKHSRASHNKISKAMSKWKAREDGSIPCPQTDRKGCGCGHLELMSILGHSFVLDLFNKADKLDGQRERVPETPTHQCPCAAMVREGSNVGYLYCPVINKIVGDEDLKHFRWHLKRGEPVIVSNVLDTTVGLSWEPLVMCRAMAHTKEKRHDTVTAIDCLKGCEVCSFSQHS